MYAHSAAVVLLLHGVARLAARPVALFMQMCPPSSSTVDQAASDAFPRPPSTLFLAVEPLHPQWQWSARGHAARLDTQHRSSRPGAYGLAGRMTIAMDANMFLTFDMSTTYKLR